MIEKLPTDDVELEEFEEEEEDVDDEDVPHSGKRALMPIERYS
jgi:hypothetical protein